MENFRFPVATEPYDPVVQIGTGKEMTVGIEIGTIGPLGPLDPQGDPFALLPYIYPVVWLIGKIDVTFSRNGRTFGKGIAAPHLFNFRIFCDDTAFLPWKGSTTDKKKQSCNKSHRLHFLLSSEATGPYGKYSHNAHNYNYPYLFFTRYIFWSNGTTEKLFGIKNVIEEDADNYQLIETSKSKQNKRNEPMKNLETTFMGIRLDNPVILGASNISSNLDQLKRAEEKGVGAVVY